MLKMAYFLSSSSSEESLCSESTVPGRGLSKRTKKIPSKLRDYIPSSTKEEEMLQKSMLHVSCTLIYFTEVACVYGSYCI